MLLSLKLHLAQHFLPCFADPTCYVQSYLILILKVAKVCLASLRNMRLQSQLRVIHYGILLQIMFSLTCSDLPDIQFEVKSTVWNDFTLSLRLPPGHLLRISPVAPVTPSKANEGGERLVDIGTAAQPAQYIGPGC